eukprot:gene9343-1430_t
MGFLWFVVGVYVGIQFATKYDVKKVKAELYKKLEEDPETNKIIKILKVSEKKPKREE